MAGAWEQGPKVLVGILHTDIVTMAWALGLRNLIIPGPWPPQPVAGMPFDHARNVLCMRAIELGATHVFHYDSDVVPPANAILKLLQHRHPFISGLYCRRSPPEGVPVMMRNGTWVTKFKLGSVVDVDLVGAGCLLIETDLLRKCPPQRPESGRHWFDWRVDMQSICQPGYALSEDFTLCRHVKEKMGIQPKVDTSVVCRHIGLGESTYGSFKPADANPVT